MIKVNVNKQSNYPVSAKSIKDKLKIFFGENKITSEAEVSVAIVGEAKMLEAGRKFMKDGKIHNVLSFTPEEEKENFIYPPDGIIHLGEIIICYPEVIKEAKKEGKLIETKMLELIEHGAKHLLGIHHE